MPVRLLAVCVTIAAATASADSVTVNPNGSGDYLTIQSAVDWAPDGSDVLIAGGDYPEKVVIWTGKSFQFRPLEGGDTVRILGDPSDPDDFPDILVVELESTLSLDGIIVDGQDRDRTTGIDHQGKSLHLEDCTVSGCVSGVHFYGIDPDINAVDCLFTGNSYGSIRGGYVSQDTLVFASGCLFVNNGETTNTGGGGLLLDFDVHEPVDLQVHNCHFEDNTGKGGSCIRVSNLNQFVITGCTFVDNASHSVGAEPGGAVSVSGSLEQFSYLLRCTFIGNRAEAGNDGGAVGVVGDDDQDSLAFALSDCVLFGNSADGQGGAVYVAGNDAGSVAVHIDNCRILGNIAGDTGGGLAASAPTFLTHTLFCGNTPNPAAGMFVDEGGNTFVDTCLTGACCVGGDCAELTENACSLAGGLWFGPEVYCGDISCDDPVTGACCLVRYCSVMGQGMCEQFGGQFNPLEPCSSVICDPNMVSCLGDVNFDHEVNIEDLLDVIGQWGPCN